MNGTRTSLDLAVSASSKERHNVGLLTALARRVLFALLQRIEHGQLVIKDGEDRYVFGQTDGSGLRISVTVHDPRLYSAVAFGGSVGSGEAYMAGYWSCDDLPGLFRVIVRNRAVLDSIDLGWVRFKAPFYKLFNRLRQNTKKGSRRNISDHYDLGNDFYSLFLDESMTYSCGIFHGEGCSLVQASEAKYDRICKKLSIQPDEHVLEIGTGWGGFAIHAAGQYGCQVTTTTISTEQFSLAKQRVREAGLSDRITILKKDYRDLTGQYNKLVSIEMVEAVGHNYLETFFNCCSQRLTKDGMMFLQAITLPDQSYELQLKTVDFIKRYIFPGSCIPSLAAISNAIAKASDLRLFHFEDITPHYATTLRLWRENFMARLDEVKKQGFSDSFIRMWEYYLSYCEGSFEERYLGDVQMVFVKPWNRSAPILPALENKDISC